MKLLERYYYARVWVDGMTLFSDLTDEQKEQIRGMWGFAFFKAKVALDDAKQAVANALSKN